MATKLVVCNHCHAECIRDKCHHSKPHVHELGIGGCCAQVRCNGTKEGPKQDIKVRCVPVEKD